MIKITERTLYEPIVRFLEENLKARAISEVGVREGYLDIFFQLDSYPFIVEIKLGKEEKTFTQAISRVVDYALEYGTKNIIVLVFPTIESGQVVLDIEKFKQQLLLQKVRGWVHTDYLDSWVKDKTLKGVFEELKTVFEKKIRKIDFNSIVKAIRGIVKDLYEVIRQSKTEEIFEEIATRLELFTGLGEIKDKQKAKTQVSMLASYLLFNQLLFHHIYKTKTKDERVEELKPIKSLKDLQKYFSQIVNIDYQPIYAIDLIDKIPERPEIIELINNVIKNLIVLRTEHITQDLAGRFFHTLLPEEVAKVWAAFYTNPIAAEILANLVVDKWDETVLDPACGSGTLLSAIYRRKLELYEKQTGKKLDEKTTDELHKRFLENDITGIDIMPFAAHLATINLSLQKLEQPTNVVRIGRMDSLEFAQKIVTYEFKEKGILLKPFAEEAQLTLIGIKKILKREETISPAGIGREFYLKPVDLVIMNPPFSDREKLPSDYREKLNQREELGKICGHQINLWGYFLALADLMLKPNGKVALVVPINIARGKATEKIRNYLLENYHIKYIVKPTKDLAFSESAAFRDILLVAEKRRPKKGEHVIIIFLKEFIKKMNFEEIKRIVEEIKTRKKCEKVEFVSVKQDLLKENFMRFLSCSSFHINQLLNSFYNKILGIERVRKIKGSEIREGFGFRPKGLSQVIVVARPISKERIKQCNLVLKNEKDNKLLIESKKFRKIIEVDKATTIPAIRSLTGIPKLDITELVDYIILSKYKESENLSKFFMKSEPSWKQIKNYAKRLGVCNVVLPDKLNLSSPNTYVISIFSDQSILPSNMFYLFYTSTIEDAKLYCLFFNSIVLISQFILNRPETLGTYFRMRMEDWKEVCILEIDRLSKKEKVELLNLFKKIKDVEFPSILEQLERRFWARVELDKMILKILGFNEKEIEEWLPRVYDAVVEELRSMKEIK